MVIWVLVIMPHLTTYHSHKGIQIIATLDLGMPNSYGAKIVTFER